jgi:hypothetical protein
LSLGGDFGGLFFLFKKKKNRDRWTPSDRKFVGYLFNANHFFVNA